MDAEGEVLRTLMMELADAWELKANEVKGKESEESFTYRMQYAEKLREVVGHWDETVENTDPVNRRGELYQTALDRLVIFTGKYSEHLGKDPDIRLDWPWLMLAMERAFGTGLVEEFEFNKLRPAVMDRLHGKSRPGGLDGRFMGPISAVKALLEHEEKLVNALRDARTAVCTCTSDFRMFHGAHHTDCAASKIQEIMNGVVK